jgi:hypothetical protein
MTNGCEICGVAKTVQVIGGAILCHSCATTAIGIINERRSEGQQTNPSGVVRQLYRKRNQTKNKILRDIPLNICDGISILATAERKTERQVILDALKHYLGGGK